MEYVVFEAGENGYRFMTREIHLQEGKKRQYITYPLPGRLIRRVCENITAMMPLFEYLTVKRRRDIEALHDVLYVIPIKGKGLFGKKLYGVIKRPDVTLENPSAMTLSVVRKRRIKATLPPGMLFFEADHNLNLTSPQCTLFATRSLERMADLLERLTIRDAHEFESAVERLSEIVVTLSDEVEMSVRCRDKDLLQQTLAQTQRFWQPKELWDPEGQYVEQEDSLDFPGGVDLTPPPPPAEEQINFETLALDKQEIHQEEQKEEKNEQV